jgi:hypothetical protein
MPTSISGIIARKGIGSKCGINNDRMHVVAAIVYEG